MSEITPEEIRSIRERLGLTQIDAGTLIGGGPRAFAKYEAGTVKPAAAVTNLLRVLENHPGVMSTLKGDSSRPMSPAVPSPFEVDSEDIKRLDERKLPELLRRLLNAESQSNDLPFCVINVPSNIHTADGGEDGRIIWQGGPSRTWFLPSRLCQFQLKAGMTSPTRAANDVVNKTVVKEAVRSVLEANGNYIMLCAHPYVDRQLRLRKTEILKKLHSSGLTVNDDQIDFRDANQIAMWVNHHLPVAIWVREYTQPGTLGPFRSWSHWSGPTEPHQLAWVDDERLPGLRIRLIQPLTKPRQVTRVVGESGIGKSRLILEAFRSTEEDETTGRHLSDIVMYAVQSNVGSKAIIRVVQNLVDSGGRAVVVVDNCDDETHRVLADMVLRDTSLISLVTIGDEIHPGTPTESTLQIDRAPTSIIEGIINRLLPGLPWEDQHRLAHFSEGFPKIAVDVGRAWDRQVPIAHASDWKLVRAFVLGRNPEEPELLLRSSALLATFGLVRQGGPRDDGQLSDIANLGRNITVDDLLASIVDLNERRVTQTHGSLVTLKPRILGMRLAEYQWKRWDEMKWDHVLAGDINPDLKVSAAWQLALLNTTKISQSVVVHVCRVGGPFDGLEEILKTGHAEVLSALAGIGPRVVGGQIERSFEYTDDLQKLQGDVRRHLARALEKVAFHSDTFEEGARLLLRLAVSEKEGRVDIATSRFMALFPLFLGSTEADGTARLSFLDEVSDVGIMVQRSLVVEALLTGCEMGPFSRTVGPEVQGSLPALVSWRPHTNTDAVDYICGCVTRLGRFAQLRDEVGDKARSGLGQILASLVQNGFIDIVETVVHQVTDAVGYWSHGLRGLMYVRTVHAGSIDDEVLDRVRKLVLKLEPKDLASRVRLSITEPRLPRPTDENFDISADYRHDMEDAQSLAVELLREPEALSSTLPRLTCGEQRIALEFGEALADNSDSPLQWLELIVGAVAETVESERNYDLLSGFVAGLAKNHPDMAESFKRRAAQVAALAPAFPKICLRLGITPSDIELAIGALQNNSLSPWSLNRWAVRGVLDQIPVTAVASLLDFMLDQNAESFTEAIYLMGSYSYGVVDRLDHLRPQVLKLAENATRWNLSTSPSSARSSRDPVMCHYQFEKIIGHMLEKGRDDPDTRAVALALAKSLANVNEYDDTVLIKPVLPKLLRGFAELVWPLIGQTIASDQRQAAIFWRILGDPFTIGRDPNPVILELPEDTLFAWCHAYSDCAPAFVAKTVPVLSAEESDDAEQSLHPVMARLLDEFGERDDVQLAVERNIHTFGWRETATTHFKGLQSPFGKLVHHRKHKLRRWARKVLEGLNESIASASHTDQERDARAEVYQA